MALLLGLGQSLGSGDRRLLLGAILGTVGLLQLAGAVLPETSAWSGPTGSYIVLFHTQSKLVLGPLLLFFFRDLAGRSATSHGVTFAAFLPAGVFLIGVAVWLTLGGPPEPTTATEQFRLLATGSTVFVSVCIVAGAALFDPTSLRQAPSRQKVLGLIIAVVCLLPATVSSVWFWFSPEAVVLKYAHLAGAALLGVFVVLVERDRDFLLRVRSLSRTYARSRTAGLDVEATRERLRLLMEVERVYRDEELTLPRLAARAELTVHQLSAFLNEHLDVNFPNFVNGYRIAEARELLRRHPDRTSLSIGMEVGFNSYTAFHTAFRRLAGMPPGRFRRTSDL